MNRQPAVAGMFYPGSSQELRQTVGQMMPRTDEPEPAFGVVMPHAGYVYSGEIAGKVLGRVQVPDTVIILGPNHHGVGAPAAVYPTPGAWDTPLGSVPIAQQLTERILHASSMLVEDEGSHRQEHSLEVQLPFLQLANPDVEIVPICLGHGSLSEWVHLGEALATVMSEMDSPPLILASTDMSHYVHENTARKADHRVIEEILALNPEGVYETVRSQRISMCGFVPVTVLLAAARARGGLSAKLVHYGTSGDVTGDREQVVGYAGLILK